MIHSAEMPRPVSTGPGGRACAALSLVMHAALLAAMIHATTIPVAPSQSEGLIIDILQAESPPAAEETAPPEPEPPKPAPPEPKPLLPLPKPPPRPPILPKPVAALPTAAPQPSSGTGSQDSVAIAAVQPSQPAAPAASGPPAPDDALRLYGQMVWARIAAHKPRGVRLPGSVTVTFALDADGQVVSAEIADGKADTSLGQVALDTVRRAAPYPPPPPGASRGQLTFAIPFQFR
ncbi:energy transducer TonB family protein [Paramagnetospirillum marisnigri]|nr:energy transducer TonB [Paramagnetospirillum marisnigri]